MCAINPAVDLWQAIQIGSVLAEDDSSAVCNGYGASFLKTVVGSDRSRQMGSS